MSNRQTKRTKLTKVERFNASLMSKTQIVEAWEARLPEDEAPPWNVHRLDHSCPSCGANEWRMPNMVERITGMICRKCEQVGDEKRGKKMSAQRRVCLSDAQQRNSAKWRVAGLAANIEDVLRTYETRLHEQELFALRVSKEHMEKVLATWSQD